MFQSIAVTGVVTQIHRREPPRVPASELGLIRVHGRNTCGTFYRRRPKTVSSFDRSSLYQKVPARVDHTSGIADTIVSGGAALYQVSGIMTHGPISAVRWT